MDQNAAAIKALHEYVHITAPKYALMIEAPWGAGKTYLVKQEFRDALQSEKARYATLNGVKDQKAFRRALLAGASDAGLSASIGKLAETIGTLTKLGNVGSIVQDTLEDRMIANLPDLLILDDIERCELSPAEVLGFINEFVEHSGKNVVLCAYIERDDDSAEVKEKRELFLTLKEKVVGRTIRIVADGGKAIPEFVAAVPDGYGKEWFTANIDLALEVFDTSNHSNLRIMRQCLHDCSRVIDVLDADLRASSDAMCRFVYTYLALSMAVARGKLSAIQLADRDKINCVTKPRDDQKPHPLSICFDDHPRAEVFSGNGASILPTELGVSLIGTGYEEPERINKALRATNQFSGDIDIPLWRRFIEWRWLPSSELEDVYAMVVNEVFGKEQIEPGPYLHMANDLIAIAGSDSAGSEQMAKRIEDRILALSKKGAIPAAPYGVELGWSSERGFSFGGFMYSIDGLRQPLVEAMRNAQVDAFNATITAEAERILALVEADLDSFTLEISGRNGHTGYHRTEILHLIDPQKFAEVVFDYIRSGKSKVIGEKLEILANRHSNLQSRDNEVLWSKKVKEALNKLAEDAGVLEKARMDSFFSFHWKFSTATEIDEIVAPD